MDETGPEWTRMNAQRRRAARGMTRDDVPPAVGVYAWYRDDQAIYAGRALGSEGLRGRVWKNHLATSPDLSRSSFRRNVCEHLGIAPASVSTKRPTVMTGAEVDLVNAWIRACEVTWIACPTAAEAEALERALLAEWMPPLSRR